jgi:hypothetical protein
MQKGSRITGGQVDAQIEKLTMTVNLLPQAI